MAYALSPTKENVYDSLQLPSPHVVKEGNLYTFSWRVKDWHKRYCYLIDDGTFLGYRQKRSDNLKAPVTSFSIKKSKVIEMDEIEGRPAENAFSIQGISWVSAKERLYKAATAEERKAWMKSIQTVAERIKSNPTSPDVKIATELEAKENYGISYSDPQPGPSGLHTKRSLRNFVTEKVIGKGSYGKVVLSREEESGKLYAIKMLDKNIILSKDKVTCALTENRVLQRIDHPFLIKLRYSFTTEEHVVFVMDYANGGDLFTHLYGPNNTGPFSEERARFYAAELCLAIGYLHKRSIIHRDIKLENVLLDSEGHVVLADFGVSKEDMCYYSRTQSICGTPQYTAPEVITENGYGRSVDWWCYGLVLYEMLTGLFPFASEQSDDEREIYSKILNEEVSFPEFVSREAAYIIYDLLKKDPVERLGCGPQNYLEITRHIFFAPIRWKDIKEKTIPPPFKPDVESDTDTKYFDTMYLEKDIPSMYSGHASRATGRSATFDDFEDFDYTFLEERTVVEKGGPSGEDKSARSLKF